MVQVSALKSVVLTSPDPDACARFYREVLGLALVEERHRGTLRHWAGQIGMQHFAVHPREGFWLPHLQPLEAPDTIVSFDAEVEAFEAHLAQRGVPVLARTQIGPMSFLALRDPDGRHVCVGSPWPERGSRATSPNSSAR